jgi:hypothetical protein
MLGDMTEPNTPEAPEADAQVEIPEREITFLGRQVWVKMPRPEQLLVWRRTLTQLQGVDPNTGWTADSVMAAMERLRKIVDSTLANKADVEWIDDLFLDGSLTFQGLVPIINLTVKAYADAAEAEGNRETRRAAKKAGPAKKATRKKAARS